MHNSKPYRKGSKYNADNKASSIDPLHYPFLKFPKESPVQPGNRVEWMDEDEHVLTGTVLEDGAYLQQNVLYVRVDFGDCIDAVRAEALTKVFDYETLDAETRIVVQQKTGEIKGLMRRATQDIIDIGSKLIDIKAKLGHGSFGVWLDAEFGWAERTARNFMAVATTFKSATVADLNIGAKALYMLAAPSTPEEARDEAIERAQNGEVITHATAKTIVAQHKGAPPVKPAPQPEPSSLAKAYQQAGQILAPATRPPTVTYGKLEDDYQPDVPDMDVNDLDSEESESTGFKVGDTVNDAAGHGDGEILELDPQMGALVKFPNHTPWWLKTDKLVLVRRAAISQARTDLQEMPDSPARARLTAIVDQHEADAADRVRRVANWQEHERLRNLAAQTPPPVGQYRTIVIDPPWPMKKIERGVRPNQGEYLDYPTMQLADIYNLGIEKLAADDGCHLYLWTTHKFLPEALRIVSRWGFRYNCLMTWVKTSGMTPYHYRFNTEHVVFATRGSMAVQRKGLPLAFDGESLGHSRKPDTFYQMVAQASPAPRLEMFARQPREEWTVWGNEVQHATAAAS